MVNFVFLTFFGLIWFAIIQIGWNAIVYKQKNTFEMVKMKALPLKYPKNKWLSFSLLAGLTTALTAYIMLNIPTVLSLPVISLVVSFVNSVWNLFIGYLKPAKWGLFAWFLLLPIVAFIYFSVSGYIHFIATRRGYYAELREREAKELAKNPPVTPLEVADDNATIVSDEAIPDVAEYEPKKRVDVPITKVRYNSPLGIMKAYEDAKTKGLQIGETEKGYVAVYASPSSRHQMQGVLSGRGIDITGLPQHPSIVFFDENKAEYHTVRTYAEELSKNKSKGGHK